MWPLYACSENLSLGVSRETLALEALVEDDGSSASLSRLSLGCSYHVESTSRAKFGKLECLLTEEYIVPKSANVYLRSVNE